MTHKLRQLMSCDHPSFAVTIRELERSTGHEGIDVRLIADIYHHAHVVMRRLGLDPNNTTAQELYRSLEAHRHNPVLFRDTAYVGVCYDGEVVSFNVEDVAHNYDMPFHKRSLRHMRRELIGEMVRRYREHPRTHDSTVEDHFASIQLVSGGSL